MANDSSHKARAVRRVRELSRMPLKLTIITLGQIHRGWHLCTDEAALDP